MTRSASTTRTRLVALDLNTRERVLTSPPSRRQSKYRFMEGKHSRARFCTKRESLTASHAIIGAPSSPQPTPNWTCPFGRCIDVPASLQAENEVLQPDTIHNKITSIRVTKPMYAPKQQRWQPSVVLLQPKYQSGHLKYYMFSLSTHIHGVGEMCTCVT